LLSLNAFVGRGELAGFRRRRDLGSDRIQIHRGHTRREEAAAKKAKSAAAPKRSLFEDLCQTHSLSVPEQALLRELSKSLGLSSPTLLLVEPKHLQARAEQGGDSAAVASKLVEKLFGDLAQLSA
jgi:hypothetical protein